MTAKHVIGVVVAVALVGLAVLKFSQPRAPRPGIPASAAPPSPVPRLHAPKLWISRLPIDAETSGPAFASAFARWTNADRPKLTAGQVEVYLRENHRSPASLLAAARTSGDKSYLREAVDKYPNDPRVAFDAYFLSGPYDDTKPATDEWRQWLENFKHADPNNALPNYLAARDDFKAGQTDLAVQELQAASGQTVFQDYLLDSLQNTEEAYLAAGYSEAEAKSIATWDLLLPHLPDAKQLSQNLVDLANQYRQSGDTASAEAILQMGTALGGRFNGAGEFPLINTFVGIAIQRSMFAAMDPDSPYLDTGLTVQNRLDALNQYRTSLKPLAAQEDALLPKMSDAELVSFYDRLKTLGEVSAIRWAVDKYGSQ